MVRECLRDDNEGGLTVAAELARELAAYERGLHDANAGRTFDDIFEATVQKVRNYECEIRAKLIAEARQAVDSKLDTLMRDNLDAETRDEALDYVIRLVQAMDQEKRKPWHEQALMLKQLHDAPADPSLGTAQHAPHHTH